MIDVVQVPAWERFRWLRHGFSTRTGGVSTVYSEAAGDPSLNLGWTKEDDPAHVAENRRRLLLAIADEPGHAPVTLRQVHTTAIHTIRDLATPLSNADGRAILEGDGLATSLPGVFLGIQTADCVPIMLLDPVHRAVAVLHAGWRGTAAAMAEAGVARMKLDFGSQPDQLLAAVGPSIGPCCYRVGDEVRDAFAAHFAYAAELFDRDRLDLWQANRRQLLAAGLLPENLSVVGECTGCTLTPSGARKYFSHRIDRGIAGRMMSVIGIAGSKPV